MTTATVFQWDNLPWRLEAKGHAGYAEEGEDIVCAGISVLMQTAVMALEDRDIPVFSQIKQKKGDVHMVVALPEGLSSDQQHDGQIILRAMQVGLQAIQEQYPEFLRIIHEHRRWKQ